MSGPGGHGAVDTSRPGANGDEWTTAGIVARLDTLVVERDAGDVRRAATRCGVTSEALAQLAAALADDGRDAPPRAAGLLAAVARGYRVDATWLVTGAEDFRGERLAPLARLRVAELLQHVGERVLAARHGAVPTFSATAYDSPHDDDPPP